MTGESRARKWREEASLEPDETNMRLGLSYPALLGHFARVVVQRDALLFEAQKHKEAERNREVAHDDLWELIGREVRSEKRYYLTYTQKGERFDALIRDIRALRSEGYVSKAKLPKEMLP